MIELYNDILNWFYGTYLGGLYFEFLLWLDRKLDKPTKYLTPKEIAQVVRQYSLVGAGVTKVKSKVNTLVNSKSKEEYHKILSELENMMDFAQHDLNSPQAKFAAVIREVVVKKNNKDIVTATDRAKMIEKRIDDMYELQAYTVKRNLIKDIKKAIADGNTDLAKKLQEEFKKKYGRSNSRR